MNHGISRRLLMHRFAIHSNSFRLLPSKEPSSPGRSQDVLWAGPGTGILFSCDVLFYYLRLIASMYATPDTEPTTIAIPAISMGGVVLAALTGLLLWLGVYPNPVLHIVENMFPK